MLPYISNNFLRPIPIAVYKTCREEVSEESDLIAGTINHSNNLQWFLAELESQIKTIIFKYAGVEHRVSPLVLFGPLGEKDAMVQEIGS